MAEELKCVRDCELCKGEASVYCSSDSAYLCWGCDAKVHSANFLVARHVRASICRSCGSHDGYRFSGARMSPPAGISCRICSQEVVKSPSPSSSTSSSCVSSTTEAGDEAVSRRERVKGGGAGGGGLIPAVDLRVEGILVNWCRRMAVDEKRSMQVVSTAVELIGGCLDKMTVLPFRVSLAAAFWVALRLCGGDTCRDLTRVEQISGVPGKLILATEARLARVLKRRRSREDHEEGWAEC